MTHLDPKLLEKARKTGATLARAYPHMDEATLDTASRAYYPFRRELAQRQALCAAYRKAAEAILYPQKKPKARVKLHSVKMKPVDAAGIPFPLRDEEGHDKIDAAITRYAEHMQDKPAVPPEDTKHASGMMTIHHSALRVGDRVQLFDGPFGWAVVASIKDGLIRYHRPYVPIDYDGGSVVVAIEDFVDTLSRDINVVIDRHTRSEP